MSHPIIHHVSAINRDAKKSYQFYTHLLGMELLLNTVNQDDVEMYHLFFADTKGRPGTDFTTFEMKSGIDRVFGTNAIERTIFAVPSIEALHFWEERLNEAGAFNCELEDYGDSKILRFEDFDGIQLGMTPIKKMPAENFSRETADISQDHAIIGIASVHLRVRYAEATANVLQDIFNLEVVGKSQEGMFPSIILSQAGALFEQDIRLIEDKKNPIEEMGIGGTHHIAISVKNLAELEAINIKVNEKNYLNSGIKDREFFQSLYFRDPNNILIEVATEESSLNKERDDMTENLSDIPLYLPSFLEPRRSSIESRLGL